MAPSIPLVRVDGANDPREDGRGEEVVLRRLAWVTAPRPAWVTAPRPAWVTAPRAVGGPSAPTRNVIDCG